MKSTRVVLIISEENTADPDLVFPFDKAETAGADLLNILKIAKGRNIDVGFLCGFEDG